MIWQGPPRWAGANLCGGRQLGQPYWPAGWTVHQHVRSARTAHFR